MVNEMIKLLKFFFNFGLYIVSFFFPKSKKYIIIGGWQGQRYADNSKGMYEYLDEHKEELGIKRVFWYTKNEHIYNELNKMGKDVLYGHQIRSIYWHLRSKVHMIDQNTRDILGILSIRCIRIDLWHGTPLKKIGNYLATDRKTKWSDKFYSAGCWPDRYILATSEYTASMLKFAMGIKNDKCLIASYPRTKLLYQCNTKIDENNQFLVFYLPTFRDENDKNPILNENIKKIDATLSEYNIVMYIKPHFASLASWSVAFELDNIIILNAEEDVYDWLNKTNLLITDYSSVFFDFLLTGRPILFFPYDLEHYEEKERGFTMPYDENTPGKKVFDVDNLVKEIIYIYSNYEGYIDYYKKQYQTVNEKVNKYRNEPDYSAILKICK